MRVLIPNPLLSYTAGRREVGASGATLAEVLGELDQHYPGLRFRIVDEQDRIRAHIKIFVNAEQAKRLDDILDSEDSIMIVAALSGG
jgi:molybdopterin converting factor small subunit